MEYHKGEPCWIKPILCQEGYCSGCCIYQEEHQMWRPPDWAEITFNLGFDQPFTALSHELAIYSDGVEAGANAILKALCKKENYVDAEESMLARQDLESRMLEGLEER